MEEKLKYLLDRNSPFMEDRIQMLDQLTVAMSSGSSEVPHC